MGLDMRKILAVATAITFALMMYEKAHHKPSSKKTRSGIISPQQRQLSGTVWRPTPAVVWPQTSRTQQQPRYPNPASFSRTQQQQQQSFPQMQQQQLFPQMQQQQSFSGTQQQQQQSFTWTQQQPRVPNPAPYSWMQPPPQRQEPQQQPQDSPPQRSFLASFIPFLEPRQYSLHPISAFEQNLLCTDIARPGCNEFNTIRFTAAETPAANEFRYHNTGPLQMQGVFWTIQTTLEDMIQPEADNFANTDLVTFARTRHGGGISTGALQTDENGFEYVMRPLGDHSWSTSSNSMDTQLTNLDVLYMHNLVRGTLDNPLGFEITPNFKVFFDCFRFNFGDVGGVFTRFGMDLVTDPNNTYKLRYPGSEVWLRTTTFLGAFSTEYISVQVIDGAGQPIFPAWAEFQQSVASTIVPRLKADRLQDRLEC